MIERGLSGVDKALWARRGRRIAVAALVGAVLLVVGMGAVRWWNQRQEQGLAQAAEELDGVSSSLPTATPVPPTPVPTLTPAPSPTMTMTPTPAPTPFIHIAASMGAVPEAPGPVVVPLTLIVTRSDGAALGGELSARLGGDGYLRPGAGEWYTDGVGTAWEVAVQAAVDSFRGSGTLTWTVTLGDEVLPLPLRWQAGQGVLEVDDVAPAESRPPG